jgi:hypothetical protein
MKIRIKTFQNLIVLCHSYCSSDSRDVGLLGTFEKKERSQLTETGNLWVMAMVFNATFNL